ncbi:hypothetical protein IWX92DRAFT_363854 [Phyllosticta citricarpa]
MHGTLREAEQRSERASERSTPRGPRKLDTGRFMFPTLLLLLMPWFARSLAWRRGRGRRCIHGRCDEPQGKVGGWIDRDGEELMSEVRDWNSDWREGAWLADWLIGWQPVPDRRGSRRCSCSCSGLLCLLDFHLMIPSQIRPPFCRPAVKKENNRGGNSAFSQLDTTRLAHRARSPYTTRGAE